ncbi:Ribosome-binding protein 1 [Babesia ovata]|uniref:Ribosome-binding protein 1 n=1 Tax=Babesia ovata TaxID=189622 RepID=A0A2H6K8K6_9APIC|nr:Ribosome-binding protein 1 [Babesia ovata]GBE59323.1 Ribosome-binding protein 1 [Babesia ovata]
MGFKREDLPDDPKTGDTLSTILSPSCGGEDPLLTLSSYLNCLTRRTPRTTGELVSFFHNFGNELHSHPSALSPLGSALSTRHDDCPDWDCLKDADINAIRDAQGSATPNSIHDKDHPKTLSTLLGCGIDNVNCPQLMKPITYQAYALYSSSFAHHYLGWTVYLPDRMWESLTKLHHDLKILQCPDSKLKSLHQCANALPLLYSHGFTPPEGTLKSPLTCTQVITKLREVVSGEPIATLMTCMDEFLYGIREPFFYTLLTLWSIATVYVAHSLLYRLDVLYIRSHLLTTRASHLIDVKALLMHGRKMLSLYRDVDYFDDELVD